MLSFVIDDMDQIYIPLEEYIIILIVENISTSV